MRLMVLSDLHLGHPGWDGFGEKTIARARQLATEDQIDVLLFNGDICDPSNEKMSLEFGLRQLLTIPADHYLWVIGNNDIEFVMTNVNDIRKYAEALNKIAESMGIKVLDFAPVRIDGIGFAGSFGSYDLSLWQPPRVKTDRHPQTFAALSQEVESWYRKNLGISYVDLFLHCQGQLHRHIEDLKRNVNKLVVTTHVVPSPKMLLYGESPDYDYQNAWMGWDDEVRTKFPAIHDYPEVIYQFCGHTHRAEKILRPGLAPLINVSGHAQPLLLEI
ncbi:hypothetical protein COT97_03275 [Candidatus Falkowbacteria bacterium CG10_big_fil_rev_8_21_14_0_10_39_11]|uniref:Calcineurin-like phosphoesterase domain-containing protein n=1 Tax=Candidatus Falkowbacteria bacterium CG10_big_fil_rev_8_21_14_0_10_39_11 TaxID=1974565 RepID=A0A2H0V4U4_9BACT|nr:MAG: hypothetical protein COT97_03275 [Candidatus Falkowbacteria bacterium CG10_big_fil_rev_8_21_14_0_10_39_11]